jgi:hypothetical protein
LPTDILSTLLTNTSSHTLSYTPDNKLPKLDSNPRESSSQVLILVAVSQLSLPLPTLPTIYILLACSSFAGVEGAVRESRKKGVKAELKGLVHSRGDEEISEVGGRLRGSRGLGMMRFYFALLL